MSATNRGRQRETNDFYPTPSWLTEALVPYLGTPLRILEPAAGEGAITTVLQRAFPHAIIDAGDITTGQDFLTYPWQAGYYDLIITNPPYSLAEGFARRALELVAADGTVGILSRVSFVASQGRATWMRETHPSMYVTPGRPCFVRGKSDNCEYAWLLWNATRSAIVWLKTETINSSGDLFRRAG